MRTEIEKYINIIKKDIKNLSSQISYKNCEIDETNVNIEVKHILEGMQSVLDYMAVDIYEKYYGPHDGKIIYFPYTKRNEEYFKIQVNKYFPNLYDNHQDIYGELAKTQCFNDKSNWIIKLKSLTNEVKHNELYITKIKKEKNVVMKSNDTSMLIKGDSKIQKMGNRYGIFGPASCYIGGKGRVGFYSNGTIKIGDGTYNVDTKKTTDLTIETYYEYSVKSKEFNEDIIVLLNQIFNKEVQLVSNLERFI